MDNRKGMTIVELLLSVILISFVLVFVMQLCLRARNAYLNNSVNVKYELSKSILINAIMDDYVKKGINSTSKSGNTITFNYKDGTTKTLSITENTTSYIVKYSGADDQPVGREYLKSDIVYGGINNNSISSGGATLNKYVVVLNGKDNYNYSINLYFKL